MTIDKLDGILRKFEDVHHQKPEYICLAEDTYQEIARQSGRQLRADDVMYLRNVRLKAVYFQSPAEVICCGKRFEERYLVTPGGDIITSEMRPDSAAALLIRIAEVYAQYLFRAGDVIQTDISDEERDELYDEITVVEANYANLCTMYELDEGAFIAKYGRYGSPDVENMTIQMDVLIHGGTGNG
ncbi:MAG: hypothetical protein E7579_04360 [Ruminococcaceae bacterium]|nr:hypothetical protein [Oscillospiraceae bacterium]